MNHPFTTFELPWVLLVDDEVRSQDAMRRTLDEWFYIVTASNAEEARQILEKQPIHVILCDQRMPGMTGVQFLQEVRERWPDTVRMIISGYTDSEDIISGVNEAGIFQYILKPWMPDHLVQSVQHAVETQQLARQTERLNLELRTSTPILRQRAHDHLNHVRNLFEFDRIIRAPDSPMEVVCQQAAKVARYDLSVLLLGESGTGKELLAHAIHYASPRLSGPFVVENCAAIPDSLLESELFGHKKGAFTGASEDHMGLIQRAHGGTLFLDEIGETSPSFQVKLLRVLQEGEVRPVGANRSIRVDVRVVCATHRDLRHCVAQGLFREDLYYRLAGISLMIPPLRERSSDIGLIAQQLLLDIAVQLGRPQVRMDMEMMQALQRYDWPGNVRELYNELARAIALHDAITLQPEMLSPHVLQNPTQKTIQSAVDAITSNTLLPHEGTLAQRLEYVELAIVRECLERHQWHLTHVAQELGLSRVGLNSKLKRWGLK